LLDHADHLDATSRRIAVAPALTTTPLLPSALWASAATVAVCLTIFAGRTDPGVQRAAAFVASLNLDAQPRPHPAETPRARFDAETATRQLSQTVQELAEDRDRLTAQLVAIEHSLDDMTGAITGQAEAAKAGAPEVLAPLAPPAPVAPLLPSTPWPDPPGPSDAATIIALIAPATEAPTSWSPNVPAPIAPLAGYGADIGSALSLKSLHTLLHAFRAAHPQLFQGLQAGVTIRDNPRSNRAELRRLVVWPFADADAAAQRQRQRKLQISKWARFAFPTQRFAMLLPWTALV
jgi:hypothetical protein